MKIKIIKATLPAWYEGEIGQVLEVFPEPLQYSGGMGYMCRERIGGVLAKDCEVAEED